MKTIQLSRGLVALVDDEDYERVAQFTWHASVYPRHRYAATNWPIGGNRYKHLKMHRFLLGAKDDQKVDHIDGDGLNNQRANIRLCTSAQNSRNVRARGGTSIYKGVAWIKRDKKWTVTIRVNQRNQFIGNFNDEIEAARAHDDAARRLHGEFARLNFPRAGEQSALLGSHRTIGIGCEITYKAEEPAGA